MKNKLGKNNTNVEIASTKYLYHHTKDFDSIKGIIQEGFRVSICLENYYYIEKGLHKYIPEVCFTDLPDKCKINHKMRYGKYAIALTKEWAERNDISPVLYLRKSSAFTRTIKMLWSNSQSDIKNKILAFCKPFCARFWDKHKKRLSSFNRRFYDEREWRYVPKEFLNDSTCTTFRNLTFKIDDIGAIYIPKDINAMQQKTELIALNIPESKIKFY